MKRFVFAGIGALAVMTEDGFGERGRYRAPSGHADQGADYAAYNWTGFYVGINGGYGWGTSDIGVPAPGSYNINGGLVGGTVGYNWQIGQAVYGLEGDLDWANIRGNAHVRRYAAKPATIGSAPRVRLGYAFDRFMPFCHRRRGLRQHQGSDHRRSPARATPSSAGRSAPASNSPLPVRGPPRSNISMRISASSIAAEPAQ